MDFIDAKRPATAVTVNEPQSDRFRRLIVPQYSPTPSIEQAARKLAAQFGLTASVAMVICTLNGLGGL
jgi:hypothetical protein